MDLADLSLKLLQDLLPGRPVRYYPALLSTDADARAWCRSGAPAGAIVVADYQASPRGRNGLEWRTEPGIDLSFSLVVRPGLEVEREGWLYTATASGVADVLGDDALIEWPDEIKVDGGPTGAVGVHAELGPDGVTWAVASVLIPRPTERPSLTATLVTAIESRLSSPPADVLEAYLPRSATLGRKVRALMIPMGPGGPRIEGTAVDSLADGALVIETNKGRRVAVRPQNLGLLEALE
jgi:BirA family biotin operon repressor/biotin-[acetyl-CoA-carboxylase] ligase